MTTITVWNVSFQNFLMGWYTTHTNIRFLEQVLSQLLTLVFQLSNPAQVLKVLSLNQEHQQHLGTC